MTMSSVTSYRKYSGCISKENGGIWKNTGNVFKQVELNSAESTYGVMRLKEQCIRK